MNSFLYFFMLITGYIPSLFVIHSRMFYKDRKKQGRRIKKGALIISNHFNIKDYMMIMFMFPFRKVYCLVADVVYKRNKILAWLLKVCGCIKVTREDYSLDFISKSIDLVNKGKVLVIFPESKLSIDKNILLPFKSSYVLIALKTHAPIIPIYHQGIYGFFKTNKVIVGTKIYLNDYVNTTNPSKEEIEYLNNLVRENILNLKELLIAKIKIKKSKRYSFKKLFWDIGKLIVYTTNIGFHLKVNYAFNNKKEIKEHSPLIICANHPSFNDPLFVINAFYYKRVNILTAKIVFKNKVQSFFVRGIGCIKIDRNINDLSALKKCKEILENYGTLLIFFEGHIDKNDELNDIKNGVSLIASLTNCDILPVYIRPKKKKVNKRNSIYIGKIIETKKNKKYNLKEIISLTEEVRDSINQLEEVATNGK